MFVPTLVAPLISSSYILDLACGTGEVTSPIKVQQPSANILGAILVAAVLETYRGKAKDANLQNVETRSLDVRDLEGLGANVFTHVLTNFEFAPDPNDAIGPRKAARGMWEVYKPGGVTVITT